MNRSNHKIRLTSATDFPGQRTLVCILGNPQRAIRPRIWAIGHSPQQAPGDTVKNTGPHQRSTRRRLQSGWANVANQAPHGCEIANHSSIQGARRKCHRPTLERHSQETVEWLGREATCAPSISSLPHVEGIPSSKTPEGQ